MRERELLRGLKELNLSIYNPEKVEGDWDIPLIENDFYVPEGLVGFHTILSRQSADKNLCVHFYLHDVMFQRIWNRPYNYVKKLQQYGGMLSPDFSLYMDMPRSEQLYNVFRNRLIGQYMQREGIKVIPSVAWGDQKSFSFCFDGIEAGSVVSVSSIGVIGDKKRMKFWRAGMEELLARKQPRSIIF